MMKRGIEVGPALLVKRGCCQGGGRKGQCEDGHRIGIRHACWRVRIFGSGKSNRLKEREDAALHKILCNGCLLRRRIATFSPSLSLSARFQLLVAENLGCAAI